MPKLMWYVGFSPKEDEQGLVIWGFAAPWRRQGVENSRMVMDGVILKLWKSGDF